MGIILPLEQKQKIRELRAAGLSYTKIKDMVMELFGRKTLSLHTIHSAIHEDWDFAEEAERVVEDFHAEDMIDAVNKAFFKKRNDLIKDNIFKNNIIEQVGEKVKAAIKPYEFKELAKRMKKEKLELNSNILYVFFWDMHYWRTTEALMKNVNSLTDYLVNSEYLKVVLVIMGDNFESPILWGMHDSQNEEMDVIGVKQVLGCMDMIANMILTLKTNGFESISVIGLTGNHDRVTKSHKGDPQRIAGILWYYYLQGLVEKQGIEVSIVSNKVCNYQTDNLNFILHHGDWGFNTKPEHAILAAYGKEKLHNVIVSWHWHNAGLTNGPTHSRIFTPGMNITSDYEKHQFITKAAPGFVTVEDTGTRPAITFRFFDRQD